MVGLPERGKPGAWKLLQASEALNGKALWGITVLYPGESGGIVPMKRR